MTLLPTCLQCYLPELFLEVDFICWCHFITDMIVYTYAKFGMNCLNNKWNITDCSECCSVYDEKLDKFCLQLLHNLAVCGIDMAEHF